MIQSMTGFASHSFSLATEHGEKALVTVQLKTLNARFFESNIRLAHIFSHLETKAVALLKQQLKRGTITLSLYVDNKNIFKGAVSPDLSTIESYLDSIQQIQKKYSVAGTITINDLIKLDNVFVTNDTPIDERIEQEVLAEIEKVIAAVVQTRATEGAALAKDLQERIALMAHEMTLIKERATQLMAEQKEKIGNHVALMTEESDQLAEQRKMILCTALDKMDVHEEIVRFTNHLHSMKELLSSPGIEKGKRLDFTLQELGREINTISAKCADSAMAAHAINVKIEIEKAREQSQNIV
jgi:uncharacterized protein (TIGR00255 family)